MFLVWPEDACRFRHHRAVSPLPGCVVSWWVYDGFLDPVDGPFGTVEEAETAARSHRDSFEAEEHHETMVAWSWSNDGSTRDDKPQPWRSNWDDLTP